MVNHAYHLPILVVKSVATSGHVSDLAPNQFGIFNDTLEPGAWNVATGTGEARRFFLAAGSSHTRDKMSKFYGSLKRPIKSGVFLGTDIQKFEKTLPTKPENEEWVLGYDGTADSKGLSFECGKISQVKIRVYGDPVFNKFTKSLEKIISYSVPCCDVTDCTDGCQDNALNCKVGTLGLVKAINDHVEFQEFKLKAYPVFSDYAATAPTKFEWSLTTCASLLDVQSQYPTLKVETVKSVGCNTTFKIGCQAVAPAAFTPKSYSLNPVCGVCDLGYTLAPSVKIVTVKSPLGSTDLVSTDAERLTFATTVTALYAGTAPVFVGRDEDTATIQFQIAANDADPVAQESDIISSVILTAAVCNATAAVTPVAWAQGKGFYTTTRTLSVKVDQNCDSPIVAADINTALLKDSSYVAGSAAAVVNPLNVCADVFTVTQTSNCMSDLCMSPEAATFSELLSFKGLTWTVVEPVAVPFTGKCGIRITAPYASSHFGDCSYDPNEYFDNEPLRMEVSVYDTNGTPCAFAKTAEARMTKGPKYRRLSGDFVRKEYIAKMQQSGYYAFEKWSNDPRMREVFNNLATEIISRDKYYVAYYLNYKEFREYENFGQAKEVFEPTIYVEEGDVATQVALEKALTAITSKFNVNLKKRG
jgi:hypothetical protein